MRILWTEKHERYDAETDDYVDVERQQGIIVPDCCETAQKLFTVRLNYAYDDLSEDRFANAVPRWRIDSPYELRERVSPSRWDADTANTPQFCPFCGTKLPEIRRVPPDQIPGKLHTPMHDGDYCGTCKERSRACTCLYPELAWETVPA